MTPRRVVTTERADEDIVSAVAYYVECGASDAALRLVDALEEGRNLLAEHPAIGSPRLAVETGVPELRSLALQRFPYLLLYADDPDAVRVLHTRREIPAELVEQ